MSSSSGLWEGSPEPEAGSARRLREKPPTGGSAAPALCYLGLGANLGGRALQLARAIAALASAPELLLRRVSPVYETEPVGYRPGSDNPRYLNLAVAVESRCQPHELLALAHLIEGKLGRERPFQNAPRTIDIDLLACDDIITQTPTLTLPHPRMWERQFVLAPLADIAPDLTCDGHGPVAALVDHQHREVRRLGRLADLVRSNA